MKKEDLSPYYSYEQTYNEMLEEAKAERIEQVITAIRKYKISEREKVISKICLESGVDEVCIRRIMG